jgi:lipopolysaccharide/colanic/teichoic acid biosynthesis glycosyltransferase
MFPHNWFDRLRKRPRSQTAAPFHFLHPVDRFAELLETERLRADRSGDEFAVLVFRMETVDADSESLFANALRDRLRTTDHAGRFGHGRDPGRMLRGESIQGRDVAVILWNTGVEGAHRFAAAMREKCGESLPPYEIYLYPTDPPYFDDGEPAEHARKFVIRRDNLHAPLPQVKPLETLFIKPLPAWKRALDVFGAACGLLVLSPLMLLTAVLVKLTSRGPVLFTQTRDGLGGRSFQILKFRTMTIGADAEKPALRADSEQDGPCFKMKDDPRVTPIGRYLRKSCIDELPQLWNVLKGEMTLVGPRPLDSREAREITGWGRRRMEVTPGLTCIWQVHGKSGVSFAEWMRMDIRYLAARTFLRDVKLILQTAVAVVLHKASV